MLLLHRPTEGRWGPGKNPPSPLPAAKQQKPRMQFLLSCWLRAGLPFGAIRARLRHDKKKARRCAQEYLTGGQVQSRILVWSVIAVTSISWPCLQAAIAQLGECQTEDLKVPGSIPGLGMTSYCCSLFPSFQPLPPYTVLRPAAGIPCLEHFTTKP